MELPDIPKVYYYLVAIVFIATSSLGFNNYVASKSFVNTVDQNTNKKIDVVAQNVESLGKAFQYNQLDISIDRKNDQLKSINQRAVQPGVTKSEKDNLNSLKQSIQEEINNLKEKQKKYE